MGEQVEVRRQEGQEGIAERLKLVNLLKRYEGTSMWSLFALVNGFISIAIVSTIAMLSGNPFVFPSLGPTVFLHYATPKLPTASPRNTIYGHTIGLICGWVSVATLGLLDAAPALQVGVSLERVVAAGLAVGLTSGFMVLLQTPHPPACATTLIVALGLIIKPFHIGVMFLAVVVLVVQAIIYNRLAGLDYPYWRIEVPARVNLRTLAVMVLSVTALLGFLYFAGVGILHQYGKVVLESAQALQHTSP